MSISCDYIISRPLGKGKGKLNFKKPTLADQRQHLLQVLFPESCIVDHQIVPVLVRDLPMVIAAQGPDPDAEFGPMVCFWV